jgi:tetratricopeptide (TPR) repeat protein
MSYYYLAVIACIRENYRDALELVESGLVKNWHNGKARGVKAVILRKLGRISEAGAWIKESLTIDPFDFVSLAETIYGLEGKEKEGAETILKGRMRGFSENYLQLARDYGEAGFNEEACGVLRAFGSGAMVSYYLAYYEKKNGMAQNEVRKLYQRAEAEDSYCCFPNKLEDIDVLKDCMEVHKEASYAPYYLGNLYYDKKQYEKAVSLWELSAERNSEFPTVWRNLSLAYYNHMDCQEKAKISIEKAFTLDLTDSRVFLEMDQLHKKLGYTPSKRLAYYEKYKTTALVRDDSCIEYVTLKNFVGEYEGVCRILTERNFHPWEGGEGKAAAQYVTALVEMAKKEISRKSYEEAREILKKALIYPENLGEGKLEGSKDNNINYYLGIVEQALGNEENAKKYYETASTGSNEVAGMMYYNDQPADMIFYQGLAKYKLGLKTEGSDRFNKLIEFGESHIGDEVKIEYFAVSFPDFMIYNEDFIKKNKAHCCYVIGLGYLGLGNVQKAKAEFEKTLELDIAHNNCRLLLNDIDNKLV